MADPTTTNLQLAVPTHGSDVDTWDAPLNADFGIIDAVAGGVTPKVLTNANVTLSTSESQVSILRFTGTLTGNCIITLAAIIKSWICENFTLGAFTITITGGSGNVVAIPPGSCQIYWDGNSVRFINLGKIGEYWDDCGTDTPLWVSACTVPPAIKCDGSTFNATTYPQLNAKLGGNTLPDMRGRARAFLNGGTGRITTAGSAIDGDTRLSAGGAENIVLSAATIPAHTHTFVGDLMPTHAHSYTLRASFCTAAAGVATNVWQIDAGGTTGSTSAGIPTGTNSATGGSAAHNNMPPTCIGGITLIWAI